MNEKSSLFLLADVALHNLNEIDHNFLNSQRRKNTNIKMLKVNHLHGEIYAEINDLKNLPISILLKIFVDKFQDENLHNVIYVCKFGIQSFCCNTKFMDMKENKIHALEHLVRCHLLEHLTKIKSGVMIKLPKKSGTILGVNYVKQSDENMIQKKLKNYDKQGVINNMKVESIPAVIGRKCETVVNVKEDRTVNTEEDGNNSKSLRLAGKTNSNNIVVACETSLKNTPMEIKSDDEMSDEREIKKNTNGDSTLRHNESIFDHCYATNSNLVSSPRENVTVRNTSYNIDINNLYQLNSEPSNELHNLMIFETLHCPVNMFIVKGKNLHMEQLPLVGSEVEITSDMKYSFASFEIITSNGHKAYHCPKCLKMYIWKKSLYAHFRGDCSNVRKVKPKKNNENNRFCEENESVKRKQPLQDKNNNHIFFQVVKENSTTMEDLTKRRNSTSILKKALLKNSNAKKPIINISNVWSNINVQYI